MTALSADTGTAGDFITNAASQTVSGTFTGTLGAGEKIQVSADGGTTWVDATPVGATWTASGRDAGGGHRHAVGADDRHGRQHDGRHRPQLHAATTGAERRLRR